MVEQFKHLLCNFRIFIDKFRLAFVHLATNICRSQITGKCVPRRQTGPYIFVTEV